MNSEKRNARVVVALIGSLTFGASVLIWMEPRGPSPKGDNQNALLMAQNPQTAEQLTFTYATSMAEVARGRFDGVIRPDGQLEWESRAASVRVAVVGAADGRLNSKQTETLLGLVRWLNEQRGLDLRHIVLDRGSDSRMTAGLPTGAQELTELLQIKGLIR